MNHHSHGLRCLLCNEKITTADPELQHWWVKIKEEMPSCHISWAFREKKIQDLFVKEGKSRALWPTSAHNFMKDEKPCARAVDLFQLSGDGKALFSPGFYFNISQFLIKLDAPIDWSGSWKTFGETNHFELKANHGV